MSQNKEPYELLQTKISPQQAALLDAICNVLGVNTYQIFQMFFYVLCKASAPMHELSPEIKKIMTLMETDAGWAEAFNLANPNELRVAQVVLILEQKDKKGFGAVMIDKPFMNDARMTECVDDILERVTEVTMHGIYRRLRLMGATLDCQDLSEVLMLMLDAQMRDEMDEQDKVQMNGEAMYDYRGRRIEYGKKSKAKQHRTPDSLAQDQRVRQQTITFDDSDATTTDAHEKPYGEKADDYLRDLEERARKEAQDGN